VKLILNGASMLGLKCVHLLRTSKSLLVHCVTADCTHEFSDTVGIPISYATKFVDTKGGSLGKIFYLSYLVFQFPQNLPLQCFPIPKLMRWRLSVVVHARISCSGSINIFVWSVALSCHAACKNFRDLVIVRVILGWCEGCDI
jgi:hypothetical protein